MYAVIDIGGKQARVVEGERVQLELTGAADGDTMSLTPLLLVDGEDVLATTDQLSGALVNARVIGMTKGPKIIGFTYKNKSRSGKRWGHRQKYTTVEITGIQRG